jgi:hypothetical protein
MGDSVPLIRLEGDKARCSGLVRYGKSELQRTQNLAARLGVSDYQRYTKVDADTYIITKVMRGKYDIINIVCKPFIPTVAVTEEEREEVKKQNFFSIYSGFTRGDLITLDPGGDDELDVHDDFNPTEDCRRNNPELDEDQNYQDVTRLYIEKNPDITAQYPYPGSPTDLYIKASQYVTVRPCQYTGLMAKAVSVMLGYGTFDLSGTELQELLLLEADSDYSNHVVTNGFQVLYDHRFTRCHAIVRADDGVLWLVECSAINGILAEPLRYLPADLFTTDKGTDFAVGTAFDELGGLPLGNIFPDSRSETQTLIDEGELLELMTPTEYEDALLNEWSEYSDLNSWAFNDTGKAARVTAFKNDENGFKVSGYFELAIRINALNTGRVSSGQPIGTGTAAIVELKEPQIMTCSYRRELVQTTGVINETAIYGRGGGNDLTNKVLFYHPETKGWGGLNISTLATTWNANYDDIPEEMESVVWVGFCNGIWEEATFHGRRDTDLEYTYTQNWYTVKYLGTAGQIGLNGFSTGDIMGGQRKYYNPDSLPLIIWNHVTLTSVDSDPKQFEAAYHDHYWMQSVGYSVTGPYPKLFNEIRGPYSSRSWGYSCLGAVYHTIVNWKAFGCRWKDTFHQSWIWWPEFKCFAQIPPYNRSAIYLSQEYLDDQTKDVWPGMNFNIASGLATESSEHWKMFEQVPTGFDPDINVTNVPSDTPYIPTALDSMTPAYPRVQTNGSKYVTPFSMNAVPNYNDIDLFWGVGDIDYSVMIANASPGYHPDEWNEYTWPSCSNYHENATHKPHPTQTDELIFDDWKTHKLVCDGRKGWENAWYRFEIPWHPDPFPPDYGGINPHAGELGGGLSMYYGAALAPGGTGAGGQCSDIASQAQALASAGLPDGGNWADRGGYADGKPWEAGYLGNAWLVCDTFIDLLGTPYKHFGKKEDVTLAEFHFKLDYHCQHSVIGEPAVIYSNVWSKRDEETFNIETVGKIPELPETTDTHDYKVLTFIGVNSE